MASATQPPGPNRGGPKSTKKKQQPHKTLTTATQPSRQPRPTLQTIPWDIFHLIARDLSYGDLLRLSATNKAFHASLLPASVCPAGDKRDFYLRAEHFPQNRDRLACFVCWRMRPRDAFADAQRTGSRAKTTGCRRKKDTAEKRYCTECGVRDRLFGDLRSVRMGKWLMTFCHRCGEFNYRSQRCTKDKCFERAEETEGKRTLEMLPRQIQVRIFGYLGYADLIALKSTNRRFYNVSPEDSVSIRERYLLVRKKEVFQDFGAGVRWGCFSCFTVKEKKRFPDGAGRLRKKMTWIRRCSRCLQLHQNDAAALAKWKRQKFCKVCLTLRIEDEECEGCLLRLTPKWRIEAVAAERKKRREEFTDARQMEVMGEVSLPTLWPAEYEEERGWIESFTDYIMRWALSFEDDSGDDREDDRGESARDSSSESTGSSDGEDVKPANPSLNLRLAEFGRRQQLLIFKMLASIRKWLRSLFRRR